MIRLDQLRTALTTLDALRRCVVQPHAQDVGGLCGGRVQMAGGQSALMVGIRQFMLKKTKSRIKIRITRSSGGMYVAILLSLQGPLYHYHYSYLPILLQAVSCESSMALPHFPKANLFLFVLCARKKNGQCAIPHKSTSCAIMVKRRLEN